MSELTTTDTSKPDAPTPDPVPDAREPVGEPREAPETARAESPTRSAPDDTGEPQEPDDGHEADDLKGEADRERPDEALPDDPEESDEPAEPEASAADGDDADPAEPEMPEGDDESAEPEGSAADGDDADPAEPETPEESDEPAEPEASAADGDDESDDPAEPEEPEAHEGPGAPEKPDDDHPELELELKPYRDSVPYSVEYTASLGADEPDEASRKAPEPAHKQARDAESPDEAADDSTEPGELDEQEVTEDTADAVVSEDVRPAGSEGLDSTAEPSEPDESDDDGVPDGNEDETAEEVESAEGYDPEFVKQRIDELDDRKGGEGHAPGRHLEVSEDQLKDRLGKPIMEDGSPKLYGPASQYAGHMKLEDQKDPLTNSTVDGVHGGVHRCGPYATKFENPEDLVTVDEYCRQYIADNGMPPDRVPIEDVLGKDGHERCNGYYLDPSDPDTALKVDFEGGFIKPVYQPHDGEWRLHTMYPNPAPMRHP
ncbi:hypothetical protein ACIRBY_21210 [Streptomyces sp. NPDC096136]|uniref:hypothetical protein n=1 Tax=Streptomyces sp. NPDC096136 TaxID=3366076 RepID=UPI00381E89ED